MKKFLIALLLLSSSAFGAMKDWTIYVHMNGDNSLCPYTQTNLKQMETQDVTKNAEIIVAYDCDKQGDSQLLRVVGSQTQVIYKSFLDSILHRTQEFDMGDWKWMADTAIWAFKKYPAKHHMVVIWNHGSGWKNKALRAFTDNRGVSYDDQSGHHITTPEIGQAMDRIGAKFHVDMLGYDACLMQMAEVGYEVGTKNVDYIIGSEQTEPGDGWDYTGLVKALLAKTNPAMGIVDASMSYYATNHDVTMSVVSTKGLYNFAEQWRNFVATTDKDTIAKAMESALSFYDADYKDIGSFFRGLAVQPIELETAYSQAVVYNMKTSPGTGMSIYWSTDPLPAYKDLKFSKDTGWLR